MLVKLRRNWFASNGIRYKTRDGLAEIPEDMREELPSDAVIMSEDGSLPTKGAPPLPGFGAKPLFEQALDQIPHAAPTHQSTFAAGTMPDDGLHPPKEPVAPEGSKDREKQEAERFKKEHDAWEEDKAEADKNLKEVQSEVDAGLKKAEEITQNLAEARGDTVTTSPAKKSTSSTKL